MNRIELLKILYYHFFLSKKLNFKIRLILQYFNWLEEVELNETAHISVMDISEILANLVSLAWARLSPAWVEGGRGLKTVNFQFKKWCQ